MGKIIENYSLQHQLGSGVYSRVFKAINLKTKQEVAIKMVKADKFRELPKLEQGTINEINILSNLEPCPNIIRYYDMLKTVNNFYFVYEFCNGGTLEQILKNSGALSESQGLSYFKQIIEAFKILTKHNIMHRDLKPENILLNDGILKIADFGFCKVLQNPDEMARTMLGSPIYMAPEILKGEAYTIKADVWSLGVILFRLLFGFCPFESTNIAKLIVILENQQLRIPSEPKVSPLVTQLIRRMLTKDSKKRADWQQVFSYQINQSGTMRLSKEQKDSGCLKSMNDSGVGTASSSTNYPLGSDNFNRNSQTSNRDFKGRSEMSLVNRQHQNRYQSSRNDSRTHQNRQFVPHQSTQRDRSKSPLREKIPKIQTYVKNHTKCLQINSLALQVTAYSSFSATCISYVLIRGVEKELESIIDSARKQANEARNQQDGQYSNIIKIITQEVFHLKKVIQSLKEELLGFRHVSFHTIEEEKRTYLKEFIKNLQLESREELVMTSRLIDYVEESLLIRRETYQKLSKDQLQRQIANNSKLH